MKFAVYIAQWRRYRKGKCPAWKLYQDKMIENHISPVIGSIQLAKITEFDIDDVLLSVREKGLSTQTERHVYNVLNNAFRAAVVRFKLISISPVVRELHCNKVINRVPKYLDPIHAWALLDYTKGDYRFGMVTWLQVLAGLRVGEALGLRWIDVDFTSNKIMIRNVWNKNLKIMKPHTKNGSTNFSVPMIPALSKYLRSIKDKTGFVCRDNQKRMVKYEGYKTWLRRIGPKLGIEVRSSHGLRHTSTEVWMSAGASREDVRAMLNHNTIRSTERYIHRPSDSLDRIAKQIGRPSGTIKKLKAA